MRATTPSPKTFGKSDPVRSLYFVLALLLVLLQFELWFGAGGLRGLEEREDRLDASREETRKLEARNRALEAEVDDLKSGLEAMEERARSDLGMIREGETFIQVVDTPETADETPGR